jgi:FkbM family methyltransferase
MTPEIRAKLDRTPGRDVLNVLASFFSWDSATAFLTSAQGLEHRRTKVRSVVNTGIVPGIGHFCKDEPFLRRPPFNMIPLEEAWSHFDKTTIACDRAQDSYGLDQLDQLIIKAIPATPGFFIEIGAYDGVTQSNSVLLEAAGWRGLLVEANPSNYAKCVRSRPAALVEHAACVGINFSGTHTTITDVGLMSMTAESAMERADKTEWLSRGEGFSGRPRQDIDVPVATLSALLDRHSVQQVDLLILDVEGAEIDVLKGLDFDRHGHAPAHIVAEDAYNESIASYLSTLGYVRVSILLERKFTRDCLYRQLTHQSVI